MKIEAIHISGFGNKIDWQCDSLSPGLNLLFGANEAGKSTLVEFLRTVWYGFKPKRHHPYEPRIGRGEFGGRVTCTLDSGRELALERHLRRSTESIRVVDESGTEVHLSQQTPGRELLGVSRTTFVNVFAIGVGELRDFDKAERPDVVRYFFGLSESQARISNPRKVREDILNEMVALAPVERRGRNSRQRQLQAELREAKAGLAEAVRQNRLAEELLEKSAQVNVQLEDADRRQQAWLVRLKRVRALKPALALVEEIHNLQTQLGELRRYRDFPLETEREVVRLWTRCEDIDGRIRALGQQIRDTEQALGPQGETGVTQLDRDSEPEASAGPRPLPPQARATLTELEIALVRLESAQAAHRQQLQRRERLDGQLQEHSERVRSTEHARRGRQRRLAALGTGAAIVAGAAMTLLGAVWAAPGLTGAGIALGAVGLVGLAMSLAGLTSARVGDVPSGGTLEVIRYELGELDSRLPQLGEDVGRQRHKAEQLARTLGLDGVIDAKQLVQVESDLAEWERVQQRRGRLSERLGQLRDDRQRAHDQLDQARRRLGDILDPLGTATLEAFEQAVDKARQYRDLATRLEQDRDQLAQHELADEAEELLRRRREGEVEAGEEPAISFEQEAELEMKLASAQRETKHLLEQRARLSEQIEQAKRLADIDQAQARIDVLKEDLSGSARRFDSLQLARHILLQAMERYRQERQPSLFRRAGRYFSTMTRGRYTHLNVPLFADESRTALEAIRAHGGRPWPVERLSRGTQEQLYLAIRFGLADEITDGRESIPLMLDDLLVNFDDDRLQGAIDVLAELGRTRQVLLFTCHQSVRQVLRERLAPNEILLAGD